jgi:uncharacterized protein (DUF362 family)
VATVATTLRQHYDYPDALTEMNTRRSFLGQLASTAVALTPALGCARKREQNKGYGAKPTGRARVVVVRSSAVVSKDHKIAKDALRRMLDQGLRRLTGMEAQAALGQWIRPIDTVGLKVNGLAGRPRAPHVELVEALVSLLQGTGLPRKHCIVFDRSDLDLRRSGYPIRTSGNDYRCMGNDRAGYEESLRVMPTGASRFSNVATRKASVLINLPVLKDHGIAGISGALKNNFGLVHNPNKFHLNGCDPHVAEVNSWGFVHGKQRLVVCDALRVQVEGGPAFHPAGAETYGGILLATDPVALDMVAWEIVEQLRKQRKLPSLEQDKRKPVYILTAARKGLGVADRKRIEVIRVKV